MLSEIAPDFRLLDAWSLPIDGDRDDFVGFLEAMSSFDPVHAGSTLTRVLFWIRLRLGALLGWDDPDKKRVIPGAPDTTLRTRLADGLRDSALAAPLALREVAGGFVPLYQTADEWAAEVSNDTVHGVMHIAWVEGGDGRYHPQLGVYVKPRGLAGAIYLKLISPFRHLVVYPSLLRAVERAWAARRVM